MGVDNLQFFFVNRQCKGLFIFHIYLIVVQGYEKVIDKKIENFGGKCCSLRCTDVCYVFLACKDEVLFCVREHVRDNVEKIRLQASLV